MESGLDGFMISAVPIIITIIFVIVFGGIIVAIISGIINYSKNKRSPILTTNVRVITKRMEVTHHHHHQDNMVNDNIAPTSTTTSSTTYYTTFETEAGERIELALSGKEYGLIVEGDEGELIYQGEWFKQFKRSV